jgi:hypothetical protein
MGIAQERHQTIQRAHPGRHRRTALYEVPESSWGPAGWRIRCSCDWWPTSHYASREAALKGLKDHQRYKRGKWF